MNKQLISVDIQHAHDETEETEESDNESVIEEKDEDLFSYLFDCFLEKRNTTDLTLLLPRDLI